MIEASSYCPYSGIAALGLAIDADFSSHTAKQQSTASRIESALILHSGLAPYSWQPSPARRTDLSEAASHASSLHARAKSTRVQTRRLDTWGARCPVCPEDQPRGGEICIPLSARDASQSFLVLCQSGQLRSLFVSACSWRIRLSSGFGRSQVSINMATQALRKQRWQCFPDHRCDRDAAVFFEWKLVPSWY